MTGPSCAMHQRDPSVDGDPRFLCDEMLQRLGRWLRAAGYDTTIARSGASDRELLAQARGEERWLLTRDRHMARFADPRGQVILLEQNSLEGVVAELSAYFAIDWLYRPFSRCMVCNSLLVEAAPAQYTQIPEGALRVCKQAWYCPNCARLYWVGSHVRRMRDTLERFSRQYHNPDKG